MTCHHEMSHITSFGNFAILYNITTEPNKRCFQWYNRYEDVEIGYRVMIISVKSDIIRDNNLRKS